MTRLPLECLAYSENLIRLVDADKIRKYVEHLVHS